VSVGTNRDAGLSILVARSLAGSTATPIVCARTAVRMIVFVNAMIPIPGETPCAWWGATGAVLSRAPARADQTETIVYSDLVSFASIARRRSSRAFT
jgi:hypothetical protein